MDFQTLNLLVKYAREYGHNKVRVLGLSDTEHTICTLLFAHAGLSQDQVAEGLKLDKTTVARALLTLEEKAYITRRPNPDNRRKNVLEITEAGKRSIARVVSVYDEWLGQISSCLSGEEQQRFDDYCSRLLAAAKKRDGEK